MKLKYGSLREPWIVVFSAALFFLFEFMQVNIFNALNPGLIRTFNISGAALGELSAVYFYASISFIFMTGVLIDKCSIRSAVIIGMATLIICTFLFGAADAIWQIKCIRFIMGIAGCLSLTSAVKLACQWFPANKLASVVGLIVAFAMCGGVLSQAPITALADHIGWRNTLFLDGLLGMVLLLLMIFFVRENTHGRQASIHHDTLKLSFTCMIVGSLKNMQNWLCGIYTLFMNTPILLLGAMWGSLFLTQARHLDRINASFVLSMIFIGTIIGAPTIGKLSDKLKHRRSLMILAAILAIITIFIIIYVNQLNVTVIAILFFCLGFFTSAQVLIYPLIAESNPLFLLASAEGLAQTLVMCGGLIQPIFGYLLEKNWNHAMLEHMPVYSITDYQHALIIMPIGFLIALLSAVYMQSEKPKAMSEYSIDVHTYAHIQEGLDQT